MEGEKGMCTRKTGTGRRERREGNGRGRCNLCYLSLLSCLLVCGAKGGGLFCMLLYIYVFYSIWLLICGFVCPGLLFLFCILLFLLT